MSLLYVNKLNLLFYIIILQTWQITTTASIYYRDYNNHDILGRDLNDYLDYNLPNSNTFDFKNCNNNQYGYMPNTPCTPKPTTPRPSTTCAPITTKKPPSGSANKQQANDIIEHIVTVIKSMREHAIALIRNINILESDILSTSAKSSLEELCKNSSFLGETTSTGLGKIVYPEVLYKTPGYLIKEWSMPVKDNVLAEVPQTNEFVEEAQEAVKSWKKQIENCKHMLDNAVHNALLRSNLKNNFVTDPLERKKNKKALRDAYTNNNNDENNYDAKKKREEIGKERLQKLTGQKNRKYYSLYDTLRAKADDY